MASRAGKQAEGWVRPSPLTWLSRTQALSRLPEQGAAKETVQPTSCNSHGERSKSPATTPPTRLLVWGGPAARGQAAACQAERPDSKPWQHLLKNWERPHPRERLQISSEKATLAGLSSLEPGCAQDWLTAKDLSGTRIQIPSQPRHFQPITLSRL